MQKLFLVLIIYRSYIMLPNLLLALLTSASLLYSSFILGAEAPSINAAPTSFVLVGTITSTNSQPLALIQFENGKLHFHSLSDQVDSYTITKIQRKNIQLRHSNQFYTLYLHHKFSTDNAKDTPTTALASDLSQQILINRKLLDHIRTNIQQWLNAVSLNLEITDGRVSGYIIESINNIPLKASIGLKQGDIIKSINGIHVSQPELFTQTVDKLIDSSDIYIQVERAHKTSNLIFHVSN